MKIRELEVNQQVTITLLVKSATDKKTRANKPYLAMEFFDGSDTISGNYWDWGGQNIPAKNAVLDVRAQVTEWQGTKQLNIKGMVTNTTASLTDFLPTSDKDIGETYKNAYALVADVKDDFLRDLTLSILEELQDKWMSVPGARGIHHAYVAGTLIHSYSVARISKALAENIPEANVDLCVVGGFLHDLGKLFTYKMEGATIDMTDEGMLYDHLFIGAEFIGNYADNHYRLDPICEAKLEMLRHIILSHHGVLEFGAVVVPMSIEAHIVHHADAVDAAAEQIREQSAKTGMTKWTDKIWALANRPHLTTQYVREMMKPGLVEE